MAPPILSANSPVPGSISWTAFRIAYKGKTYPVAAGSTAQKYTWWPYNGGAGGALQFSATTPVITTDDCLLFLNKNGIPVAVPTAQGIDGSLIVSGSILADAIGAGQINATHIQAGTVTTDKLAAGLITADKIASGAITTGALAADAITGKTITGGSITGATIIGGQFRTATSGARTEIVPITGGSQNSVAFYLGDAAEHYPGSVFQNVQGTGGKRYPLLAIEPSSINPSDTTTSPAAGLFLYGTSADGTVKGLTTLWGDQYQFIGTMVNNTGMVANTYSFANGSYAYAFVAYGPTMAALPTFVPTVDLGGTTAQTSIGFVSTTGARVYSSTWISAVGTCIVDYIACAGT
jgi:hypothetical protein